MNQTSNRPTNNDHPIIFFDGVCTLCNQSVDRVLALDRKKKFRFASLQGTSAKKMLPAQMILNMNSIVVFHQGNLHTKSDAILYILKNLGPAYRIFGLLQLIPKPIRDFIYSLIANNRYKIFGKKETCRLPTAAEKSLFLD